MSAEDDSRLKRDIHLNVESLKASVNRIGQVKDHFSRLAGFQYSAHDILAIWERNETIDIDDEAGSVADDFARVHSGVTGLVEIQLGEEEAGKIKQQKDKAFHAADLADKLKTALGQIFTPEDQKILNHLKLNLELLKSTPEYILSQRRIEIEGRVRNSVDMLNPIDSDNDTFTKILNAALILSGGNKPTRPLSSCLLEATRLYIHEFKGQSIGVFNEETRVIYKKIASHAAELFNTPEDYSDIYLKFELAAALSFNSDASSTDADTILKVWDYLDVQERYSIYHGDSSAHTANLILQRHLSLLETDEEIQRLAQIFQNCVFDSNIGNFHKST